MLLENTCGSFIVDENDNGWNSPPPPYYDDIMGRDVFVGTSLPISSPRWLVTSSLTKIHLWHLPGYTLHGVINLKQCTGKHMSIECLAIRHHRLAVGLMDGRVCIFDAYACKLLQCIRAHDQPVFCICITSDTRHMVTCSNDGTLRMWAMMEQVTPQWTAHYMYGWGVYKFRIMDDRYIVGGNGTLLYRKEDNTLYRYGIRDDDPERDRYAGSDTHLIWVWDLHTGALIRTFGDCAVLQSAISLPLLTPQSPTHHDAATLSLAQEEKDKYDNEKASPGYLYVRAGTALHIKLRRVPVMVYSVRIVRLSATTSSHMDNEQQDGRHLTDHKDASHAKINTMGTMFDTRNTSKTRLYVVTGHSDGVVALWDWITGKLVRWVIISNYSYVKNMCIAGSYAIHVNISNQTKMVMWNMETGELHVWSDAHIPTSTNCRDIWVPSCPSFGAT